MMSDSVDSAPPGRTPPAKPRGGRPTRAAAAERDERLLDIATKMFMEQGFEATSMDKLAEAAAIGKATLYARYADKGALFVDVLRRRILQVYGPLEEEFKDTHHGEDLEAVLQRVAMRLVEKGLSAESIALGRILSSQGMHFPDLAKLAVKEGTGRQFRLVERVLNPFADDERYLLDDIPLAADLFVSLILGRSLRLAIYGIPVDAEEMRDRALAGVRLFVRGITVDRPAADHPSHPRRRPRGRDDVGDRGNR